MRGDGDDADRYRTLVESVADPMYWLAPDGTVDMVNDAMVAFLGVPRDQLVGGDASAFLDPADVTAIEELLADHLADGGHDRVRYECEMRRPNDDDRWVEANFSPVVEDGEFRGSVGVVRDVTERREREQSLANYETIVETAPVGLFTLDEDAVITWANDVFAETLGVPHEWLVGRPFPDLIEEGYYDQRVADQWAATVRDLLSSSTDTTQGQYLVETHLPDGETLVHEVHTALLPLEDGEFSGTVTAFRDITTQKRYEQELKRQNERLDQFASVASHDLRNPLNVAAGYVDRALQTGDLDELQQVQQAHEQMRRLVEDLLSLAREGQTLEDPVAVDVPTVAREAWETTPTGDATLELEPMEPILAESDRLAELFGNLFRNAVEHGATNPGSQAHDDGADLGGGEGQPLTVTVGGLDDGFYVADDGVGLPSVAHDQLFEYGHSGDGGTGLGLAIVETIAEAHGWTVTATDSAAGGARFEVRDVTAA